MGSARPTCALVALLWSGLALAAQDLTLTRDCDEAFRRLIRMAQTGQLGDDVTNANVGVTGDQVRVELVRAGAPQALLLLTPRRSAGAASRFFDVAAGENASASDVTRIGAALDEIFPADPFQVLGLEGDPGGDAIPGLLEAWSYGGWRATLRVLDRRMMVLAGLRYTIGLIVVLALASLASLAVLWVGGADTMVTAEPAPRLSVAAPCYNEATGIEAVVAEWDALLATRPEASEIVLCNDGSTDGTAEVLDRLRSRFPRLRVVHHAANAGYGRALSTAIAATRGEYVVTIDSDGQFDLADAFSLLAELERGGYDGVTGWRTKKQDSPLRVLANRGVNLLVRALFGTRLRDTNCALKVVRGDLLRGLRIEARGYPTPTEICLRLTARGHRLGECGVTHRERAAGASKLHPWRTSWDFLRFLLHLRREL